MPWSYLTQAISTHKRMGIWIWKQHSPIHLTTPILTRLPWGLSFRCFFWTKLTMSSFAHRRESSLLLTWKQWGSIMLVIAIGRMHKWLNKDEEQMNSRISADDAASKYIMCEQMLTHHLVQLKCATSGNHIFNGQLKKKGGDDSCLTFCTQVQKVYQIMKHVHTLQTTNEYFYLHSPLKWIRVWQG